MNLTIAILGAGESGVGAALLAKAKGYDVFLSEKGNIADKYCQILNDHGIAYESGTHSIDKITEASLVIKSPGIPDHVPVIREIRKKGIEVISEIEFASRYTDAKIIAITGTNGKTTTTLLTYHLLKESGFNVGVGGNLGNSFAAMVVQDPYDYYVLEISSFQLDDVRDFKPDIATLLNLTPDHLDRYENDMKKYMESKFRIAMNQDWNDLFIYGSDSEMLRERASQMEEQMKIYRTSVNPHEYKGGWLTDEAMHFRLEDNSEFKISLESLPLFGKHNQQNAMTATLIAVSLGVTEEQIIAGLKSFINAPHRMELVAEIDGVMYINDSKATNVDAVWYALDGIKKKIVWIAGGVDKGNDYDQIAMLVEHKVSHLVCLGTDNTPLTDFFSDSVSSVYEVTSMREALRCASEKARSGEVVLLSPACASFDLFDNYIDRGDQFRNEVERLKTLSKNNI